MARANYCRPRDTDELELQAAKADAAHHATRAENLLNVKRHLDIETDVQGRRIRDLERRLTHYHTVLRALAAVRNDLAALAAGPPPNADWAELHRIVAVVWGELPKKEVG